MRWQVLFHPEFEREFQAFDERVQDELLGLRGVLEHYGPAAKRPWVDTLKGSAYANLKELRFSAADGVWRVAFAFDPERRAVLLVAGDKSGISEKGFYQWLIAKAEQRYAQHLAALRSSPTGPSRSKR